MENRQRWRVQASPESLAAANVLRHCTERHFKKVKKKRYDKELDKLILWYIQLYTIYLLNTYTTGRGDPTVFGNLPPDTTMDMLILQVHVIQIKYIAQCT